MRYIIITLIALLYTIATYSQNTQWVVQYEYDTSGNRIVREMKEISLNKSAELNEEVEPVKDVWGERKIIVYPNPTKGNLKINISGGEDEANYGYSLYDATGSLIGSGNIRKRGDTPLNMSKYKNGIYFLVLTCSEEKHTFKIVKE